jgi:hypothetical protein
MSFMLRLIRNLAIYLIFLEMCWWSGHQGMQHILINLLSGTPVQVEGWQRIYYLILMLFSWPGWLAFLAQITQNHDINNGYQWAGAALAVYALFLSGIFILFLNKLLRKAPIPARLP